MTKKEKNLAMTKNGIAAGTKSPRNDKAGNVIARLRQQPKQSYISVNEIATSGLRPPRNDKVSSSHCEPSTLVIASRR